MCPITFTIYIAHCRKDRKLQNYVETVEFARYNKNINLLGYTERPGSNNRLST